MDPNAGRFVEEERAAPEMNRYEVGDSIEIDGDHYEIEEMGNRKGRGYLVLRAKSVRDREIEALKHAADFIDGDGASPRARHDRRHRQAKLRRQIKKLRKRDSR